MQKYNLTKFVKNLKNWRFMDSLKLINGINPKYIFKGSGLLRKTLQLSSYQIGIVDKGDIVTVYWN